MKKDRIEIDSKAVKMAEGRDGEKYLGVLLSLDDNELLMETKLHTGQSVYGAGEIFVPISLDPEEPEGTEWVLVIITEGKYIGYGGYFRAWDTHVDSGMLNSH